MSFLLEYDDAAGRCVQDRRRGSLHSVHRSGNVENKIWRTNQPRTVSRTRSCFDAYVKDSAENYRNRGNVFARVEVWIPVPLGVLWPKALQGGRCAYSSVFQFTKFFFFSKQKTPSVWFDGWRESFQLDWCGNKGKNELIAVYFLSYWHSTYLDTFKPFYFQCSTAIEGRPGMGPSYCHTAAKYV